MHGSTRAVNVAAASAWLQRQQGVAYSSTAHVHLQYLHLALYLQPMPNKPAGNKPYNVWLLHGKLLNKQPWRCMILPGASPTVLDPSELAARVSKVLVDGEPGGCAVRITQSGLCVTASHCLVDDGKFLEGATAFGGSLELAGSSPSRDIMFVRGRYCCSAPVTGLPSMTCRLCTACLQGHRVRLGVCLMPGCRV